MATTSRKPSTFLLFPWGLLSIVLVLGLNLTLDNEWFSKNWSWIALVLIIPAAILENFKVGYSTMRIMFMKVVYSLISFLLVGMAFGSALSGWHIEKFQKIPGCKNDYTSLVCNAGISGLTADTGSTIIQYAESCKKRIYADGS